MNNDAPGISYAKSVEQLGIFPVYPPREDIQVGDIYASELHPGTENVRLRTAFVTSEDLTPEIKRYLNQRYKFADTAADKVASVNGKADAVLRNQTDAMTNKKVLDKGVDLQTLPIAGFPEIQVDSGIIVGVQGGLSSLGAAFGFQGSNTRKMTLHFDAVTSYQAGMPDVIGRLQQFCQRNALAQPNLCSNEALTYILNQKFQLGSDSGGSIAKARPVMVSKVYLARQIDFTFEDANLAAAAAAIAGKQGGKTPTVSTEAIDTAVQSKDADTITALAALQTAMNGAVNSAAASGTDGVTLSVAAYSKNTITLREVFERPVVVGYEAVSERADEYSGKVQR